MAKDKISDYSSTANSNTDIAGINIDEGCAPSGINDAIRTLMAQLKTWQSGGQDVYIHPAGSAAAPSITANGDTNTGLFFPAADTVGIATGGTERARVDSSGNLGVGTTSPSKKFVVSNAGSAGIELDPFTRSGTTGAALLAYNRSTSAYVRMDYDASQHLFFTSGSQAMTLNADGNLLVGETSAPSSTYRGFFKGSNASSDVSVGVRNTDSSGFSRLVLGNNSGVARFTIGYTGSTSSTYSFGASAAWLGTEAAEPLVFQTNGTERARIDSSGSFFVGATSLSGNAVQIYNNSNQAGRININKTTSGLFNALVNTYSGTTVGGIDYSNTGTAFNTSSDIRLKKDIVDAGSASAKIDQIRIVSHGWKHDDEVVEFGVVAQELVNVAPQAVSPGDNGEEIETTWGVDYSKLVPMLIKAHQEQQAIIQTLTARITALEQA